MNDICRLCCSKNFVNNNIFDEENALYLKMSLYLPIKVFKNDRLPQKICDKCSCKVNDFYQFCNETIEVQNRLQAYLISSGVSSEEIVDLTRIKENSSPIPSSNLREQSTQTTWAAAEDSGATPELSVLIKEEPELLLPIKEEVDTYDDYIDRLSDNSDNISLISLKKKKKGKKSEANGIEKKPRKKKIKLSDSETFTKSIKDGPERSMLGESVKIALVKDEIAKLRSPIKLKRYSARAEKEVKNEGAEPETFSCCICMAQCFGRNEMLQHYRSHAADAAPPAPPPAPPGPAPPRCPRCRRALAPGEWAAHWARHWERDRRPLRCTLCEKTFRDAAQMLRHGRAHERGAGAAPPERRFVCDLCPERFAYMRCVQAHRARAHPEAAASALALRCAVCARAFAHLNSLRRHLRAHSRRRDHLCNVCGKALSSREHLKFHLRIHSGYKPNVCKTCGKGFVKKCNLTLHERVHSGEKPHVCSHCGKAFSQRSTLVIHERYHSGQRPYVCALCGRGFVAKGLLSMHLKTTCIYRPCAARASRQSAASRPESRTSRQRPERGAALTLFRRLRRPRDLEDGSHDAERTRGHDAERTHGDQRAPRGGRAALGGALPAAAAAPGGRGARRQGGAAAGGAGAVRRGAAARGRRVRARAGRRAAGRALQPADGEHLRARAARRHGGGRLPGAGPGRHQLPRAAAGAARGRAAARGGAALPRRRRAAAGPRRGAVQFPGRLRARLPARAGHGEGGAVAGVHVLVPDEAALDLVGRADHVDQELQVRRAGGRGRGRAAAALPERARAGRTRARAAQRHHGHAGGGRAPGPARGRGRDPGHRLQRLLHGARGARALGGGARARARRVRGRGVGRLRGQRLHRLHQDRRGPRGGPALAAAGLLHVREAHRRQVPGLGAERGAGFAGARPAVPGGARHARAGRRRAQPPGAGGVRGRLAALAGGAARGAARRGAGRRGRARGAARGARRVQPRGAAGRRVRRRAAAPHRPPLRGRGGGRLRVQAPPAHRRPHARLHRAAGAGAPVRAAGRRGRQRQGLGAHGGHRGAHRGARGAGVVTPPTPGSLSGVAASRPVGVASDGYRVVYR